MTIQETIQQVRPLDEQAMQAAWKRWDSIAKPLRSLGKLESTLAHMAGIYRSPELTFDRRCVAIFCGDNGVVAQGVTQTPQETTAIVTENFARGNTSVAVMARYAGADLYPVDMGVARDLTVPGVLDRKIAYGTQDFTQKPAMTRDQAIQAVETGIQLAFDLRARGYQLFATGEMGIGNTTTSSAVASVLLGRPVEEMTGRGAGLSSDGLRRKIDAIRTGISLHHPDPADPIDVLHAVGGFDIAGMAGFFLGAAAAGIPVLVDGFISAVAALAAARLCPTVQNYLLASHVSKEPAGHLVLEALNLEPFLTADMCLGEGTGAVAVLPILDMAQRVYSTMSTFTDIEVEQYTPQQ